jgi:hypothetical protein
MATCKTSNQGGMEMQYTLIIDLETHQSRAGDEKYLFKNFTGSDEVIAYVSNMSKGNHKVHKIFRMMWTGETDEMTIGFNNGRLDLIEV